MITIDEFLKAYCNEDETNEDSCKRSQGLTMSHSDDIEVPAGFEEVPHWADHHFRTVWINDKDLSTITYCEGDIIVMQHSTQASYDREIVKAAEFYEAERKGGDIATDEQTEEYLSSLQEDRAIAAQERAIHIGEHGGDLNE
jgi:hypothetical protein